MIMKRSLLYIFVLLMLGTACFKPNTNFSANGTLSFSLDTLTFDTIFSGIGSTTKSFKVYNSNFQALKINRIYLAHSDSRFRLNIDGFGQNSLENYELAAGDSLFIFVEVKIDPGRDKMLEQDCVLFDLNNTKQDIDLVAFGQDVHLINGNDSSGTLQTQTWTADKPYLVYNSMLVDKNQVLTIEEGTKVYFHENSRMYILGSLCVNGSFENPVYFGGDRLEEWYKDAPGQWQGIWLMAGSKDNYINWAQIKNGIEGLVVDTFANVRPSLKILNTKIENMNSFGLLGRGARIFAANCVFANCGQVAVGLILGGEYEFYHCTIANFWSYFPRQTPAVYLNNYYSDSLDNYYIRDMKKAYFGNCIIYGGASSEFYADAFPDFGEMNYEFDNCLIRLDKSSDTLNGSFKNCMINPATFSFRDIASSDYELDTLSVAKDAANKAITNLYPQILTKDLNNVSRLGDDAPDIGAYERMEQK